MTASATPLLAAAAGIEVVGYLASALVVLSLTMSSVVRLRTISLVGSVAFTAYGLLIASVPIILTNLAIAAINIWFLRTELGGHRDLNASPIAVDAPFLVDFVDFHLDDIHKFQPGFSLPTGPGAVALLLTRDSLPAGVVIGVLVEDSLRVDLDYVLRPYRDSRLGLWLYGRGSDVLRSLGAARVVSSPGNDAHRAYLERVGFDRAADMYVKELAA